MTISLLVLVPLVGFVGVYYTYQAVKLVYHGWCDIKHENRVFLIIIFILWLMPWVMGLELLINQLLQLVNK